MVFVAMASNVAHPAIGGSPQVVAAPAMTSIIVFIALGPTSLIKSQKQAKFVGWCCVNTHVMYHQSMPVVLMPA
jgi:hypothetical protein